MRKKLKIGKGDVGMILVDYGDGTGFMTVLCAFVIKLPPMPLCLHSVLPKTSKACSVNFAHL